jgi:hypothetical protein
MLMGQLSSKFITRIRRFLATLANLFKGVRGYWRPSDKFLNGYCQLLQELHTVFVRGCQYTLIHCQRFLNLLIILWSSGYWITFRDPYKRVGSINKWRRNLHAIPLKNLLIKIKIQKQWIANKLSEVYLLTMLYLFNANSSSCQPLETVPYQPERTLHGTKIAWWNHHLFIGPPLKKTIFPSYCVVPTDWRDGSSW